MLQTLVIIFTAIVCVALLALIMFSQVLRQRGLERRVRAAETGGAPLTTDELSVIRSRGLRKPGEPALPRWSYKSYRQRAALDGASLRIFAVLAAFSAIGIIAVSELGLALGILAALLASRAFVFAFLLYAKRSRRAVKSAR